MHRKRRSEMSPEESERARARDRECQRIHRENLRLKISADIQRQIRAQNEAQ